MPMIKDNIEIVELTSVEEMPTARRDRPAARGPYWKAVIAFKDGYGNQMLTGTWYISKQEIPDSSVLSLVRSYFHNICKDLVATTPDWPLTDAQVQGLKRPPKPQSENSASLASKLPR
jgi:hypothetical protein